MNYDVIIVGSGPSGTSAAYPLLEAGLKILMVDGGKKISEKPPNGNYHDLKRNDSNQWKWQLGKDLYFIKSIKDSSPKLRIPLYKNIFENLNNKKNIYGENFIAVNSLSAGGLSNAWGCGVSRFSENELKKFPFSTKQIKKSYDRVTKRIGICGLNGSFLSSYFGHEKYIQRPVKLDLINDFIFSKYVNKSKELDLLGFKLDRSRLAVLTEDLKNRKACNYSGNCLWGCKGKSLYSAYDELENLKKYKNFSYSPNLIVDSIITYINNASIIGSRHEKIYAKKILLAAGTLSTSKIILKSLNYHKPIKMLSCPTAAFLVWFPKFLGSKRENDFGLGQLSYKLNISKSHNAFGSTYSTSGLPIIDFVSRLKMVRRYGLILLKHILPSTIVVNLFLDGSLTNATVQLNENNSLVVKGNYGKKVQPLMKKAKLKLFKAFIDLRGVIIPTSFTIGSPGADIHYSGTFPMKKNPAFGESSKYGEVFGLKNVHIIDAAALPILPEKPHTLTVMANADRIGRLLAKKFKD